MSLAAYQSVRRFAETPRSTEQRLIGQITGQMMQAREKALRGNALMEVLHRNREMWNVFSNDCAAPGNQLPAPLRAGIVSLALWVDRFTSDVAAGRETIDDLIEVNRSVMEGLSAAADAAA